MRSNFIGKFSHDSDKLQTAAVISVILCVFIQLIIQIRFGSQPQISDCARHLELANQAYLNNSLYPTPENTYDSYLLAPALINILLAQQWLFGTMSYNWILNMIFNLIVTYEIYWLARHFFNSATGCTSVILWSMLYSTWTGIFPAATEIPFLAFAFSALCLAVKGGCFRLCVAGILIVLANSIRPLAIIFLIAILPAMILRKASWKEYACGFVSAMAVFVAVGTYVEHQTGYFHTSSTTGGLNLLVRANDKATGALPPSYDDNYTDMQLYRENGLNYEQTDSARKKRAFEWIKNNPGKWAMLYAKGLCILYYHDVPFDGYFKPNQGYIKTKEKGDSLMQLFLDRFLKSLAYYAVMILFFISLWKNRRLILSEKGLLLIVPVAGTIATCCFQTMPRYHHPFMPFLIIWGASCISYK